MKITHPQRNVTVVKFDNLAPGWERWVMLSSDRHHDNPHCNRRLEKRHLDKAKELDALIVDCGDLFCAMQGKYDPRSSMDDIRPEDVGQDYLDRIVTHAAEFYRPYIDNFLVLGHGNHETNIRKRHGHDLTDALVRRLQSYGSQCSLGYYAGYVRFMFRDGRSYSANLKYHHGAGGGGEVTRGAIQTNRQAVWMPDADIVLNGHTHDAWYMPLCRESFSNTGRSGRELIHFVRVPGYKDEFYDGGSGFHNERWRPPKPIGCAFLRFSVQDKQLKTEVYLDVS